MDEFEIQRWEDDGGPAPRDQREPVHGPDLADLDEYEPAASEVIVIHARD